MSISTPPTNKSDLLKWKLQDKDIITCLFCSHTIAVFQDWITDNFEWLFHNNIIRYHASINGDMIKFYDNMTWVPGKDIKEKLRELGHASTK